MRVNMFTPRSRFRYEWIKDVFLSKIDVSCDSFLEVGAGNLNFARHMLNYYDHGLVNEFSTQVTQDYAKLSSDEKSRLVLNTNDFLALNDAGTFDTIFCLEVLEHVDDDVGFFSKLVTHMHENSFLVLSVPAKMKYWSHDDEAVGHFRRYNLLDLKNLVDANNLTLLHWASYGFPFTLLLRQARLVNWKFAYQERDKKTKVDRTKDSGKGHIPDYAKRLSSSSLFSKLYQITKPFDHLDIADGYIIVAKK